MKVGDLVKISMPNKKSKRNGIKGVVLAYADESIKVALSTGEVTWMYRRNFEKLNKQEV